MKALSIVLAAVAVSFCLVNASFAAQTERRYPVDPQTRWAIGAKQTPADELKNRLDAGKILIIDVRRAEQFQKESLPGAINIPLTELEEHLKNMSKETYILFT